MELSAFLRDAVVLLAAGTTVVLVCQKARIPSVAGFLLTGILIGPSSLALVSEPERVEIFAEIGVVFLLFSIGLEFSLDRLRQIRRAFFAGGSMQSLFTIAAGALLAALAGLGAARSLFLGFLVALSSTAIVLKLYADRRELEAPQGKLVIGILLFQDFLIVPMIVLTPVLAGSVQASASAVAGRFLVSLLVVSLVFVVARYLMPRLLYQIVRTGIREILVLIALLACLGMAWLTQSLDFSAALGAFIAGIVISESEYSHQVEAEVVPFRDVFNSVFFISVGMLLDLGLAGAALPSVMVLAAGIVLVKTLVAGGAVRFLRYPLRTALLVGLSLAQVGEFSFVLLQVGREHGLLDAGLYQVILASSVLTMLATPGLIALAPRLAALPFLQRRKAPAADVPAAKALHDHVVIVGFGVNGRNLAKVLRAASIPYVIIELSGDIAHRARAAGEPVFYGDATRREILDHAGIADARMIVFAISDTEAVRRSVRFARQLNPDLHILVRTLAVSEIDDLRRLGADEVVAQEFETSIEIFTRVLERFHVPNNIIRAEILALRGEDYRLLRSASGASSSTLLDLLALGVTEVFRLAAGSPAAGATIRETALRARTGATIIAVVRGQEHYTNPAPDFRLEAGDDLVLVGGHAEMDRAFDLLDQSWLQGLDEGDLPAAAASRPLSAKASRAGTRGEGG